MKTTYSISELASHINAKVIGDAKIKISGLAPLKTAKQGELTYLLGGAYQSLLTDTKASAVILREADAATCPAVSLVVDNPELAFAKVAALFDTYQRPKSGIHPTAIIADSAVIADDVSIGAHCVIGDNAVIGKNTVLSANVSIGDHAIIGDNVLLHANVTLYHGVILGDRVIIHSGAVIGADGFGLVQTKTGWQKMPQIGAVHIGNDVEIGANSCIDRGALVDTVIHDGVKIDNLVQIAHNVEIGTHTVIAGCAAIAGSTKVGAGCVIGGAVSIGGHITICDGAVFTGTAMVTGSVKQPGVYSSGTGLLPNGKWRKMAVRLRQLDEWMKRIAS